MTAEELRAITAQGPAVVMCLREDMLNLLDENARMKEALELIKSDAWTHPNDYTTDRRMRLERIGHHVRSVLEPRR